MASNEPSFSLDWAPDAIVVTGLDGSVVHVNPRAEDLFGYRKDELADKPLELLIPEGLAVGASDGSSLQHMSRAVTCAHRDGTHFAGTARWRPAPAGGGDFVVFSIRDVGEGREHANGAADGAQGLRIDALSLFAHDVRESLQAVQYLCDSLRDRAPAEAAAVSEIMGSVSTLLERLARVGQSNVIEPLAEPCALGELLGALARELTPLAGRKRLSLLVEQIDDEITTDVVLFRELLHNLLANAVRHTPAGRVEVRCRGDAHHVHVEIADTGPGIAQEQLGVLAGNHHSGGPRVAGFGLVIVRQLAQLLDCVINVDSEPGRGSRFTVVAPRAIEGGRRRGR